MTRVHNKWCPNLTRHKETLYGQMQHGQHLFLMTTHYTLIFPPVELAGVC